MKLNAKAIEHAIQDLIVKGFGVDRNDPDYKDTPARVARMYTELFAPPTNHVRTFPHSHGSLVLLRGHREWAVCPHHLLPVKLRLYVGYIPGKKVLGLSKLGRIARACLTSPVLQEVFTDRVAETLDALTEAKGVGILVVGEHGCMQCRGLRTEGDVVTSSMRGVFLMNQAAREEFLALCKL